MQYNVLEHGLIADGNTLNTAALQRLIDFCAKNGGGELYFPEGQYVLSTVFLKNNVHIHLHDNSWILGSLHFSDYCPDEKIVYPAYQDVSHTYYHCSLFVAEHCKNISFMGGHIDMRSIWDEENVRNIVHRGPKCIALKFCKNVRISNMDIQNATDLAVYFAGCKNVTVEKMRLRVYIDGISPDCSENVYIRDCDVETGDDGIVFKSSYTLNKKKICKNIWVENCKIKSRCNAIKFGTESNGGFFNIHIKDCDIRETRIAGIALESVDGARIRNISFQNIRMNNVGTPFFVHLGKRLRGPQGSKIGSIKNVLFSSITATGPYEPYKIIEWRYTSFLAKDSYQEPWNFGWGEGLTGKEKSDKNSAWQITSNVCGLPEHNLKNIRFENVYLKLWGAAKECNVVVPEEAQDYPEVYVYGKFLPAKGIYFRHIDKLSMENVKVETYMDDVREDFVYDDVTFVKRKTKSKDLIE